MAWRIVGLYATTVIAGILTALFASARITAFVSEQMSQRMLMYTFGHELSDRAVSQIRIGTDIGHRILDGEVEDALDSSCLLIEMAMTNLRPELAMDADWRDLYVRVRQEGIAYVSRARAAGYCERTWDEILNNEDVMDQQ